MPMVSALNKALEMVESLPLSDSELLSLPLYIKMSATKDPQDTEDSPRFVGAVLQTILLLREKKGQSFNASLLRSLLDSFGAPLSPLIFKEAKSSFFLGSSF